GARNGRHRGAQTRLPDVPRRALAAEPAAGDARRPARPPRSGHARPARAVTSRRTLDLASFLGPRQAGSKAIGLVKCWTACYLRLDHRVRLHPERPGGAMAARAATARSPQKVQRELEDLQLVLKARNGNSVAMDALIRRYTGFVRLKASSYFLAGGDNDDLLQEGLIGLYKAVRDFRADKETSFRSFAELCVTRQIITAIKTATRFKHAPLNTYGSFSHTPAGQDGEGECTLGDALPCPAVHEPPLVVISTEELQSLVFSLGTGLSPLEADALRLY